MSREEDEWAEGRGWAGVGGRLIYLRIFQITGHVKMEDRIYGVSSLVLF